MTPEEKQNELIKFRALNLATLDYNQQLYKHSQVQGLNFETYFNNLKVQVQEHYVKGKLGILRKWLNSFTEGFQEAGLEHNLKYSKYIKERTGYDIDILKSFHNRIDKILAKGRVTTDDQYRDVVVIVNELCQADIMDNEKIDKLNLLLSKYKARKNEVNLQS